MWVLRAVIILLLTAQALAFNQVDINQLVFYDPFSNNSLTSEGWTLAYGNGVEKGSAFQCTDGNSAFIRQNFADRMLLKDQGDWKMEFKTRRSTKTYFSYSTVVLMPNPLATDPTLSHSDAIQVHLDYDQSDTNTEADIGVFCVGSCKCTSKIWRAPIGSSYTTLIAWDDKNDDLLVYRNGTLRVNVSDIMGCDFSRYDVNIGSRNQDSYVDTFRLYKSPGGSFKLSSLNKTRLFDHFSNGNYTKDGWTHAWGYDEEKGSIYHSIRSSDYDTTAPSDASIKRRMPVLLRDGGSWKMEMRHRRSTDTYLSYNALDITPTDYRSPDMLHIWLDADARDTGSNGDIRISCLGACHCSQKTWYAPETSAWQTTQVAWDDKNKDLLIYRNSRLRVNASDITGCDFSKWYVSLMSRESRSEWDYFMLSTA
jgi:hypothetical protein